MFAISRRAPAFGAVLRSKAMNAVRRHRFGPAARRVLPAWGIHGFKLIRNLGGSSEASWLIDVEGRLHVLRNVASSEPSYLDYQVETLLHLEQAAFGFEVPQPTPTRDGAYWHPGNDGWWLLYPFLEGRPLVPAGHAARAAAIGGLVGAFDGATESLDLGERQGLFPLQLFEGPHGFPIEPLPGLDAALIRRACLTISDEERRAVAQLPLQTVYDDWHPGNILERDGTITGLVDFDSLVEAPRIVDVQNALTYLLLDDVDREKTARAFLAGYASVRPLGEAERDLIWPVMIDRLVWLLSDIAREEVCGIRSRRVFAASLLGLLTWVLERPAVRS